MRAAGIGLSHWLITLLISLIIENSSGHNAYVRSDSSNLHTIRKNQFAFVTSNHQKESRSSPVCRFLFFRKTEKPVVARRTWNFPDLAVQELCQGEAQFPFQINLEHDGQATKEMGRTLTVRHLEVDDVPYIMPMCTREFGSGEAANIWDFPLNDLKMSTILDWSDRLLFEPVVGLAMRLKIQRRKEGDNSSNSAIPDDNIICLAQNGKFVGIVELSRQPRIAERNPPPFPIPMWVKRKMCQAKRLPEPDGWVTNLLIDDDYRGLGYGKVLMWAVEGLARNWGCNYIHLHTEADQKNGAVPQSLYFGMGYQPEVTCKSIEKFSWMSPDQMNVSGLCIVEGVPLLFLKKEMNTKNQYINSELLL